MESAGLPKLELSHQLCPITALAFFMSKDRRLCLLTGEDGHINVYDVRASRLCGRLHVFKAHAIHGLYVSDGKNSTNSGSVLVWGGQSMAIVPRNKLEAVLRGEYLLPCVETQIQSPDWIYDGVLSPYDECRGILVTAHNEVLPFRLEEDGSVLFQELKSSSRPILFSAATSWLNEDCVLVAAGTVFGDIIVWKCHLQMLGQDACQVLNVFSGHEGSIFSVSLSQEITVLPEIKVRLLASCSDDRTIRVWVVEDQQPGNSSPVLSDNRRIEARETGFTNSLHTMALAQDEAGDSPQLLAVAMGHLSRIWRVKVSCQTSSSPPAPVVIYSFGEDATTQEWALKIDLPQWYKQLREPPKMLDQSMSSSRERGYGNLVLTRTIAGHSGKHIWAATTFDKDDWGPLIATGGADGKIVLIGGNNRPRTDERLPDRSDGNTIISVTVPEIMSSISTKDDSITAEEPELEVPIGQSSAVPERFKRRRRSHHVFLSYAFISESELLATSSLGRIFLCQVRDSLTWTEVSVPDSVTADLRGYSLVKSSGNHIAVLGSASGQVYIYTAWTLVVPVAKLPAKVDDIHIISAGDETDSRGAFQGTLRILGTMVQQEKATIVDIDTTTGYMIRLNDLQFDERTTISSVSDEEDLLIIGTRKGAIYVFRELVGGSFVQELLHQTRSRDAISSIIALPPRPGCLRTSFLATCRVGSYGIYVIKRSGSSIILDLEHEASPGIWGALIDAWFTPSNDGGQLQLMFCGFRSTKFIVWNETAQQEIANIECGGVNRMYTFLLQPGNVHWLRFAFTKASTLNLYCQMSASHQTLRLGGHGREIRAVAFNGEWLATGAEDTVIRIWKYDAARKSGVSPRCMAVVKQHSAGVQCLKWLGRNYLVSSAGAEELYIWKISELDSAYEGLSVVCESTYPDRTLDSDLRITSFDAKVAAEGAGLYISLVLSNSTLRTYTYSKEGGWVHRTQGRYTGACPTQIRHLSDSQGGVPCLVVCFTDGTISVWRPCHTEKRSEVDEYEMAEAIRAHQSAVKCLDVTRLAENPETYLVLTGGDDNAMAINCLSWSEVRKSFVFGEKHRVSKAHTGAIAGFRTLESTTKEVIAVSCSNDQRVKIWRMELGDSWRDEAGDQRSLSKVQLIDNQYCGVADAGDMEILSPSQILIAGVGMEVWNVNRACSRPAI